MKNKFKSTICGLLLYSASFVPIDAGIVMPSFDEPKSNATTNSIVLSSAFLDLTKRVPDRTVNEIFADNILLNLHYIKGDVADVSIEPIRGQNWKPIWEKVREPFAFSITLNPGEVFAFHNYVLPEFEGRKLKASWTQFSSWEGYKTYAGLSGNGVCHLATLINYVATKAGLKVTAPTRHDFFLVNGFDRTFGTSIYYGAGGYTAEVQNLYIENIFDIPIAFIFSSYGERVGLKVGLFSPLGS